MYPQPSFSETVLKYSCSIFFPPWMQRFVFPSLHVNKFLFYIVHLTSLSVHPLKARFSVTCFLGPFRFTVNFPVIAAGVAETKRSRDTTTAGEILVPVEQHTCIKHDTGNITGHNL